MISTSAWSQRIRQMKIRKIRRSMAGWYAHQESHANRLNCIILSDVNLHETVHRSSESISSFKRRKNEMPLSSTKRFPSCMWWSFCMPAAWQPLQLAVGYGACYQVPAGICKIRTSLDKQAAQRSWGKTSNGEKYNSVNYCGTYKIELWLHSTLIYKKEKRNKLLNLENRDISG